jgi:magnesium-transporting ATPase (P-type)
MADYIPTPGFNARKPIRLARSSLNWLRSLPSHRRGQLLDILVMLEGLFLVGRLSRIVSTEGASFNEADLVRPGGRSLAFLLLAAFFAQAIGAYFKREPLQARLASPSSGEGRKKREQSFLSKHLGTVILLATLHFALFFILLGEGWKGTGLQKALPLYYGDAGLTRGWVSALQAGVTIVIGAMPTVMVLRALVPPKQIIAKSWKTHQATEFCADLAIGFSVLVVTLIWSILILPGITFRLSPADNFWLVLLLTPLLTVPFILFYITPRGLFLVEEYKDPRAWLTIFIAMLPLARIVVIG